MNEWTCLGSSNQQPKKTAAKKQAAKKPVAKKPATKKTPKKAAKRPAAKETRSQEASSKICCCFQLRPESYIFTFKYNKTTKL